MKRRAICLLAYLLVASSVAWGADDPFLNEIRQAYAKNQKAISEASRISLAGDVAEGNRQLMAVATNNKSPALQFLVANMLYSLDPALSYSLHQKAYEALPANPNILLEWAMQQHRKGNHADAVALYKKYLANTPDLKINALLADCLIRLDKPAEAVAAWEAAKHAQNHTAIDLSVFEIYGGLSPVRRRSDLLNKIKAGDDSATEKLIFLDLNFDTDWWNSPVNEDALSADLKLASEKVSKDRYQILNCYANLKRAKAGTMEITDKVPTDSLLTSTGSPSTNKIPTLQQTVPSQSVRSDLEKAGLIVGPNGKLPENPVMARALIELAQNSEADTAANLLQRHEKELFERSHSTGGDADALHALCFMLIGPDSSRLTELSRYGWERYGDPKFAASFLLESAANGTLKPDDKDLQAALQKFPEDNLLNMIRLRALQSAGTEPDVPVLAAAIKAEYRRLSFGLAIPDSYSLKELFGVLKLKLRPETKP